MKAQKKQLVNFNDIYREDYCNLYKNEQEGWVMVEALRYEDENLQYADEDEVDKVFQKAKFFNLRDNEDGYNPRDTSAYNRLVDVNLSNLIYPSDISIDANDTFALWQNGNLKYAHMWVDDKHQVIEFDFGMKNLSHEDIVKKVQTQELTEEEGQKMIDMMLFNKFCVESKIRKLHNEIDVSIVTTAGDFHLLCNRYGLPEQVALQSDVVVGIKTDKKRLLKILNNNEFQFFSQQGQKYNGVIIDHTKPICCIVYNGKIEISSYYGVDNKRYEPFKDKMFLQNINKQKNLITQTLDKIRTLILQDDFAMDIVRKMQKSRIEYCIDSLSIEDAMLINDNLNNIELHLSELINESRPDRVDMADIKLEFKGEGCNVQTTNNNKKNHSKYNNYDEFYNEWLKKVRRKPDIPNREMSLENERYSNRIAFLKQDITKNITKFLKMEQTLIEQQRKTDSDIIKDYIKTGNLQNDVAKSIKNVVIFNNPQDIEFLEKCHCNIAIRDKARREHQIYKTFRNIKNYQINNHLNREYVPNLFNLESVNKCNFKSCCGQED